MTAESHPTSRLLEHEQTEALYQEVFQKAMQEWPNEVAAHLQEVRKLIRDGIAMAQQLERAALSRHRVIPDADTVYFDSGPGPYSKEMLAGRPDLEDRNYHGNPWSRKMDRARIIVSILVADYITRQRKAKALNKPVSGRSTYEDYEQYGPHLLYASTPWQNSHIEFVYETLQAEGTFVYPQSKLVMYDRFVARDGQIKQIVHTADQVEGWQFPPQADGSPPRNVIIPSHPAHLVRIAYVTGKYPDSIPEGTQVHLFPIPTPLDAIYEYTRNELMGTLQYALISNRATLTPYQGFAVE